MKPYLAIENSERQPEPPGPVCRAIDWLQNYINNSPYADATEEARSIVCELKAVRKRPAVDELLRLIGHIAQSEQGLEEIRRAKIQMNQPEKTTAEEVRATAIASGRQ